jgi:Ca2+-binding EF-hand superfamily protein
MALARGAANSEFDRKTVEILLRKYDQNNDGEITFNEFLNLFTGINREYNEFLDIDEDFSGTIDEHELQNVLNKKSIYLSKPFFKHLTDNLKFRTNNNGITFDIYVRVLALIQHLITMYRNIPQNRNKINQPGAIDWNLETFLRDNFFNYF